MQDAIPFADAQYVSLRSFKKDGTAVETPVWFALHEGKVVIFTDGTSYKVKRIRRNPRVELARCTMRGALRGPWFAGKCRPVEAEPERIAAAYAALNKKYWPAMQFTTLLATLGGRVKRRLILEVELDPVQAPAE